MVSNQLNAFCETGIIYVTEGLLFYAISVSYQKRRSIYTRENGG